MANVITGGICPPECLCRRNGCQCGSIGILSVLPLELMEEILLYQDPVSLLAIERSSRGMAKLVANVWKQFCKRHQLLEHTPTPICVGWKTGKDSKFSYDKALEASNSLDQKWRLLAVRFYLSEQNICVGCQSNYGEFRLKDDVLLCYRCSKTFCLYISKEVGNVLNSHGVDPSTLSRTFAPVLLSDVIIAFRSAGQSENKCLKKMRPYLGCKGHSTCSLESINHLPCANNSGTSIFFIAQRGCVITGPNTCSCLESSGNQKRQCCGTEDEATVTALQKRSKKAARYCLQSSTLLSCIHLLVCIILISKYSSIGLINGTFEPFLQLACINLIMVLIGCVFLVFILKRLSRKSSSVKRFHLCTVVIQCILLANLITEITEVLMSSNYLATFFDNGRSRFHLLVSTYQNDSARYDLVHDIIVKYSCCIDVPISLNNSQTKANTRQPTGTFANEHLLNIICSSVVDRTKPKCLPVLRKTVAPWVICFISMASVMILIHVGLILVLPSMEKISQNSVSDPKA